ncbi:DUF3168 domain-containing protein [Lichenihabitans psoromatis]|uniref:DUF3168 domain-containing protein n=1 Tax=Lichenihabitans psoromatis TaxID=2528642 RepID=UPI00103847DF|nr:DUF3168 domain-containing protein [Lichenihabitans psoromatis]
MIASDRQQATVDAILQALTGDQALATLVGQRIFDAPPGRAVTPEITIKLVTAMDQSSADTDAQRLVFDLDIWDRYALGTDLSRPRIIMGHIRRILHLRALTLVGANLVVLRCINAQGPFRDPDNVALHGIVTVSALAGHETPS